eukprot:757522-Hanusia_phi.AAC.3
MRKQFQSLSASLSSPALIPLPPPPLSSPSLSCLFSPVLYSSEKKLDEPAEAWQDSSCQSPCVCTRFKSGEGRRQRELLSHSKRVVRMRSFCSPPLLVLQLQPPGDPLAGSDVS